MEERDSRILMYEGGYMCVWMSTTVMLEDDGGQEEVAIATAEALRVAVSVSQ